MSFVPTEPGYYWAIERYCEQTTENLHVFWLDHDDRTGTLMAYDGNTVYRLDRLVFYAGPIQPPTIDATQDE